MGYFEFSEEQQMMREAVKEFAENEVKPHAAEWDEEDHCPVDLFPLMGELGITGVFVPEKYGGSGLGWVERAICLEEISRYSAGFGIALMTHHLGMYPILIAGTEEQKEKYLPPACSGEEIVGLAVTEPSGGSDFAGQKSTGELKDGKWVLNGTKCFITNSHIADTNVWTVRTGETDKGRPEITAFIIEKDDPGYTSGRKENKLGLRGSITGETICENTELDQNRMIGGTGDGYKLAMNSIGEVGRAGMAAISVGILKGCLEEAVKFSKERELYGRPIAKLQAIQFDIADIRIAYETASMMLYSAAKMKDQGKRCMTEFSMAKLYATEAAAEAAKKTMDIMGGYGVINEYPVGRFMRDAQAAIPSGGTSNIQKLIISGDTLR